MNPDSQDMKKDAEDALFLLRSPEWKQYIAFLKNRHAKLQDRVNVAVGNGEIVRAQIALAVMEDSMKQAELFKQSILQKNMTLKTNGAEK